MTQPTADPTALLAQLVELIAGAVASKVRGRAEVEPRYYSAADCPIGPRAFLDAVKRGCFPAFRAGKRILARREDVHVWIESQPARPPSTPTTDAAAEVTDEEILAQSGVRLRAPVADQVDHRPRTRRAERAE